MQRETHGILSFLTCRVADDLLLCYYSPYLLHVVYIIITTVQVNEHSALLAEHLNVTKDLLSAKNGEVAECEYLWAATKARLAQSESDKMDMEADLVHVLEPLAGKLKRALQKKGSNFKELDLDEMQAKRLGALA